MCTECGSAAGRGLFTAARGAAGGSGAIERASGPWFIAAAAGSSRPPNQLSHDVEAGSGDALPAGDFERSDYWPDRDGHETVYHVYMAAGASSLRILCSTLRALRSCSGCDGLSSAGIVSGGGFNALGRHATWRHPRAVLRAGIAHSRSRAGDPRAHGEAWRRGHQGRSAAFRAGGPAAKS